MKNKENHFIYSILFGILRFQKEATEQFRNGLEMLKYFQNGIYSFQYIKGKSKRERERDSKRERERECVCVCV